MVFNYRTIDSMEQYRREESEGVENNSRADVENFEAVEDSEADVENSVTAVENSDAVVDNSDAVEENAEELLETERDATAKPPPPPRPDNLSPLPASTPIASNE